jgi:hypothetical protein
MFDRTVGQLHDEFLSGLGFISGSEIAAGPRLKAKRVT